jgi:hypothetical protein
VKLLLNSLQFYRRSHLGVLLGTVLAAAVLTGSLLVGDSVKGSLQKFALLRLGKVQFALHTPNRFFASDLARRISDDSAAGLQLRGMAITDETQVNRVQVLGCTSNFWRFAGIEFELARNEVAFNQKLAAALKRNGGGIELKYLSPGASGKKGRSKRGRRAGGDDGDDDTFFGIDWQGKGAGKLSVSLGDVSLRDLLEGVSALTGAVVSVSGKVVTVAPPAK